jgi:4-hydroxy-2-oxoheptanedioate aldolase
MMDDDASTLRARMAAGETIVALRCNITMPAAELKAALGKGRYDFVYLDTQHVAYAEQQLVDFCGAAEELGYPVEIRIPHTRQAYLAGRFCDLGTGGILVPETMTEADVKDAVDFFYYPPFGKRSFGGATRYGMKRRKFTPHEYAAWWNETGVLGIQLESIDAIVNARQLAKPGVSYVSLGPTDLQFHLDAHPHFPIRTFEECIAHVAKQMTGTGIALGLAIGGAPEGRQKFIDAGVTVFQEFPRA